MWLVEKRGYGRPKGPFENKHDALMRAWEINALFLKGNPNHFHAASILFLDEIFINSPCYFIEEKIEKILATYLETSVYEITQT